MKRRVCLAVLDLCFLVLIAERGLTIDVCERAPKYKVAISSYGQGSGIFLLHISLGEASVTPECLRKLALELRAKYSSHYRRILADVFTSYRAAKISNFTYEQQGYGDLDNAHRARYWLDQDKGEEYRKWSPELWEECSRRSSTTPMAKRRSSPTTSPTIIVSRARSTTTRPTTT